MTVVVCSSCQVKMNIKDEMLGKKAKCPKCATVIVLEPAANPPTTNASISPKIAPTTPATKPRAVPPPLPAMDAEDEKHGDRRVAAGPPRSKSASARADVDDDDEPRPRRRQRRDEDEEDDDNRPRRGGNWTGVRSGLQLAYFAIIALMKIGALIQIAAIFAPTAFGAGAARGNNRGGFAQPGQIQNVAAGASVVGVVVMLLGCAGFFAGITHFVGQCFCCSAPTGKARGRARLSVYSMIAAIVLTIVSICGITIMGVGAAVNIAQQAQRNPQNPEIAANAVLGALGVGIVSALLMLIVVGLMVAAHVCWILFHASVAESFRDRPLQSQCHVFLAAALALPFVTGGISAALTTLVQSPTTFFVVLIITHVVNVAMILGLGIWYLAINRRIVRLIDVAV
jgi:hypothetical protein